MYHGEVHREIVAEGAIQKYYNQLEKKKQLELVSKKYGDIMWNDSKREGKQMVGRQNDLKNSILYGTKKTEMIISSTERSEIWTQLKMISSLQCRATYRRFSQEKRILSTPEARLLVFLPCDKNISVNNTWDVKFTWRRQTRLSTASTGSVSFN